VAVKTSGDISAGLVRGQKSEEHIVTDQWRSKAKCRPGRP